MLNMRHGGWAGMYNGVQNPGTPTIGGNGAPQTWGSPMPTMNGNMGLNLPAQPLGGGSPINWGNPNPNGQVEPNQSSFWGTPNGQGGFTGGPQLGGNPSATPGMGGIGSMGGQQGGLSGLLGNQMHPVLAGLLQQMMQSQQGQQGANGMGIPQQGPSSGDVNDLANAFGGYGNAVAGGSPLGGSVGSQGQFGAPLQQTNPGMAMPPRMTLGNLAGGTRY